VEIDRLGNVIGLKKASDKEGDSLPKKK